MKTRVATFTGLVLLVVSCGTNPSSPTVQVQHAGFTLSNPRVTTFGLTNIACNFSPDRSYSALDRVSFDFTAAHADILGAKVVYSDGVRTVSGTVEACTLPTPCLGAGKWCVIAGTSTTTGTVAADVGATWQPTTEWRLHVESGEGKSNEVAATITRTEGLPFGSRAEIASLTIMRCASEPTNPPQFCYANPILYPGGLYEAFLTTYVPNVSGNTLVATLNVFESGKLVGNPQRTYVEGSQPDHSVRLGWEFQGAYPLPYRVVATIRETDASGAVLVEDTRG